MKVLRVLRWIALGYITLSTLYIASYKGILPALTIAIFYLFLLGVVSLVIWCIIRIDRWMRRKLHGPASAAAPPPS